MGWQKGQTGNAKGRPPARRVEELRIYAEPKAKAAIDKLAAIAAKDLSDDPKWAEVISKACIALLDRVGMVPPKPREDVETPESEEPLTNEASEAQLLDAATKGEA